MFAVRERLASFSRALVVVLQESQESFLPTLTCQTRIDLGFLKKKQIKVCQHIIIITCQNVHQYPLSGLRQG